MRSTLSNVATCAALAASLKVVIATSNQTLSPGALEGSITTSALQTWAQGLQNLTNFQQASNNTRLFGTAGYNASVSYIYNRVNSTSAYDLELQSLPSLYSQVNALSFNTSLSSAIPISALEYSPSTPKGGLTASLVLIPSVGTPPSSGCAASAFAGLNVKGKIALIQRGNCTFANKVSFASAAGAVAVIIYDNTSGNFTGSLGSFTSNTTKFVPSGGISFGLGSGLAQRLTSGQSINATLDLDISQEIRYSSNIIATSKIGNRNNTILLGANLDTVPGSPGANDNGSGSVLNLALAIQLAKYNITNAVRFAWWTSEEYDLAGTTYYLSQLTPANLTDIALYINFKMVASPNFIYGVVDGNGTISEGGPVGSAAIEGAFTQYFSSHNQSVVPIEFDTVSDYSPFAAAGIPSGGLFSGADGNKTQAQVTLFGGEAGVPYDKNFQTINDTYSNLNFTALTTNAQAAANVLAQFALSTDVIKQEKSTPRLKMRQEGSDVVSRFGKVRA